MDDLSEIVAVNFKRLRAQKGWTQDDLANAAGVHIGTIRGYEAKVRWPALEYLKVLAHALDVQPKEFFRDPDEERPFALPDTTRDEIMESIKAAIDKARENALKAQHRTDEFCAKLCEVVSRLSDESRDTLWSFATDLVDDGQARQPSHGKKGKRR